MFGCKFDTTSDAFGDPTDNADKFEIARILREIADKIETHDNFTDSIRDLNGNTVGQYDCTRGETLLEIA